MELENQINEILELKNNGWSVHLRDSDGYFVVKVQKSNHFVLAYVTSYELSKIQDKLYQLNVSEVKSEDKRKIKTYYVDGLFKLFADNYIVSYKKKNGKSKKRFYAN